MQKLRIRPRETLLRAAGRKGTGSIPAGGEKQKHPRVDISAHSKHPQEVKIHPDSSTTARVIPCVKLRKTPRI